MARDDLTTISGHAFIVTDRLGNIEEGSDRGLFVSDTRFLSRFAMRLDGAAPRLLRSGPVDGNGAQIYATNIALEGVPDHAIGFVRRRTLGALLEEHVELANYGPDPVALELTIAVDVDFADIFEVRALTDDVAPRRPAGKTTGRDIVFFDRATKRHRQTLIRFAPDPDIIEPELAMFRIELQPEMTWTLDVSVEWAFHRVESGLPVPVLGNDQVRSRIDWLSGVPVLETDDHQLLLAYNRSIHDLAKLELALSSGYAIPAAGVPWYLAIFGRDALITSLQTLPVAPGLAIGTLRTLAAYQAGRRNAFRDAEPGKMPHEIRFGALAESDSVPHSRYYGTVDATPLWLILFAATFRWTGDRALVDELLPAAMRALAWIDDSGDLDGDGLVEYCRRSRQGLVNQGWKDSWDGIRYAGGRIAEPPIALVEVQGYVYAAKQAMADLFETIGRPEEAVSLRGAAQKLKQLVQQAFWMPNEGCYAVALDGQKRQVDGIASNQGHLLWAGLPDQQSAELVVARLMAPDSYTGWGIRTFASSMVGYNPLGYHTGSVWPHDTTLIGAGFRRYGRDREAVTLFNGLIDASQWFDDDSLPELFCGYGRSETPFPVDYPVACSPQAWAAGAMIMIVAELAGIGPAGDGLRIDPLPHGREILLLGVPFQGNRYDIGAPPGKIRPAATTERTRT